MKSTTWLGSIATGTMAKLSYDYIKGRRFTLVESIAVVFLSVFCGWMSALACVHYSVEMSTASIYISLGALLGEKIVVFITSNWKKIASTLLNIKK